MKISTMPSKSAKLAALKYFSLRWIDRMWIKARLKSADRKNLNLALKDLKKQCGNRLSYHEIENIIYELDIQQKNFEINNYDDMDVNPVNNLPRQLSEILTSLRASEQVTPHVKLLMPELCKKFVVGDL